MWLLAEIEWSSLIGLGSLLVTTVGGCVLAYVAYKQAVLAGTLKLAELEAAKRGRRQARRTKNIEIKTERIENKTDEQTKVIAATANHVAKLETNTNGLMEAAQKASEDRGPPGPIAVHVDNPGPIAVHVDNPGPIAVTETKTPPKQG